MRRAEYDQQSLDKARALMSVSDHANLVEAINKHMPVLFKYTNRFGVSAQYRSEYIKGFLQFRPSVRWPGSVCVWSRHVLHNKSEQYRCERIKDVIFIVTLIDALLDPNKNNVFWNGSMTQIGTTSL